MEYYAGIDVSLEASSVCIVSNSGKIIREAKVASEPSALIAWFASIGVEFSRIIFPELDTMQTLEAGHF